MPDHSSGSAEHPRHAPLRPSSRHPLATRAIEWIRWFGPGRITVAVASAVVVLVGGVWVVSAPPPSNASRVPAATIPSVPGRSGDVPIVTLVGSPVAPVPVTVVVVHVSGAVAVPGVHELPVDSRVVAALAAAGGSLPDADLGAINLAARVADGQRIHVPVEGEEVTWVADPGVMPGAVSGAPPPLIDVNRATAVELEALPGVGPAIAAAIVDDRARNGPFPSIDELVRVRGIGPGKLAAMRDLVTL